MRKETQKHGIPVASLHRRQSAAPPGSLRRHRRGNHRRLLLCRTCCNGQLVRRLVQQSACKQVLTRWRIARRHRTSVEQNCAQHRNKKKGRPRFRDRRSDGIKRPSIRRSGARRDIDNQSYFKRVGPWMATLHRRRLLLPVPPTNKSKQHPHTSRLEMGISPTRLIYVVF